MFIHEGPKCLCASILSEAHAGAHDAGEFSLRREMAEGFRDMQYILLTGERRVHRATVDEARGCPGEKVGPMDRIAFGCEEVSIRLLEFA